MTPTTLDIAQQWVSQGYSVIPVDYRSKRPAFDALRMTGNVQEGEITWSPFKQRLATAEELRTWFTGPKRNLGIVTGYGGLVVLDFDTIEGYDMWSNWADNIGGIAAEVKAKTLKVYSARGVHLYITCAEPVSPFRVADIDVKAQWGYVLAPPSIHPSGREYQGIGKDILHCEHLCDVFPLSRPDTIAEMTETVMINDPWEAASLATESGGMGSVERIHSRVSAADLLGVKLNGKRSVLTRCFMHDDKNPSLLVYADGTCRCLAGCNSGRAMDSIDVFAIMHHLSNREAIGALAQS